LGPYLKRRAVSVRIEDPKRRALPFGELYQRWWSVVRKAARSVVPCDGDAEDAAQRVFERLLRTGHWRTLRSPDTYFRTAGLNEALTLLRGRRRAFPLDDVALNNRPPSASGQDPSTYAENREARAITMSLISRLTRRCALVMTMTIVEGFSQSQVAARLGIGEKAVQKQVARGTRRLRDMRDRAEARALLSYFVDGGARDPSRSFTSRVRSHARHHGRSYGPGDSGRS
jgi:RNA polymerase sigma-70 factor (ECF subfamily)